MAGAEVPQRISLLAGLGALAASPAAKSYAEAAPQLAAFASREPTDEAKTAALEALAKWLKLQKSLQPDVRLYAHVVASRMYIVSYVFPSLLTISIIGYCCTQYKLC